jgi:hypothetical protein
MIDIVLQVGTSLKEFLAALLFPLQSLTTSMDSFDTLMKKSAKFNGQKMVLQAALNDLFSITVDPKILIENNFANANENYFYNTAETTKQYFFNSAELDAFYFFNTAETTSQSYDFKVLIPISLYNSELERRVKNETTLLKLAGTRFIIQTY